MNVFATPLSILQIDTPFFVYFFPFGGWAVFVHNNQHTVLHCLAFTDTSFE